MKKIAFTLHNEASQKDNNGENIFFVFYQNYDLNHFVGVEKDPLSGQPVEARPAN